jgi:lipopolysaccharide exporter
MGPLPAEDEEAPQENSDQPLSRATWKGLQWTYGASIVGALLQVGYTAAMGRLLTPADFGLLAIALVFLRFGQYFAQMGVGPALVQAPEMSDRKIRTAFSINLALSTVVAIAFVLIAGLARLLLDDPGVVPVVRVMAVGLVLAAAGTTAESLLRRELRFRRLAVNQLVSFVFGYLLVGLVMAILGAGVWSLVAAHLCQTGANSLLSVVSRPHPAAVGWNRRDAISLISFGGRVSIISFAEFLGQSLDTLVIGRVAGGNALGQYNRAFLLVNLPLERLMQGVQRVLFPAFSRIQSQRDRLVRVYRSALRIAAAVLLPTAAGMAVAAEPLVLVVLGSQWTLAAEVLPFLALSAVGSLLALFGAIICESTADLNRKLLLQSGHVVVLLTLLLVVGSDLRHLAAAVACAQLIRVVGYFSFMSRVLGTSMREHLRALLPAMVTALVVGLLGGVWSAALVGSPPAVLLVAHVCSGALVLATSFRFGPLSGARRDLTRWLQRAAALERIPAPIRRIGGLNLDA